MINMLHTIKQPNQKFNLLFMDYRDYLLNNYNAYVFNNDLKSMFTLKKAKKHFPNFKALHHFRP